MSELAEVLQKVKQRIERYGANGINEQDTKATLLQPVLRALGWDVEDLEDVQREYKIRKQDKPVTTHSFCCGRRASSSKRRHSDRTLMIVNGRTKSWATPAWLA